MAKNLWYSTYTKRGKLVELWELSPNKYQIVELDKRTEKPIDILATKSHPLSILQAWDRITTNSLY